MSLLEAAHANSAVKRGLTLLGIVAGVRPLIGPHSASVEISTRCNYHCLMCPYHSPLADKVPRPGTDFMDLALAAQVFKEVSKLGAKIVNFGHRGEPMMHPDFASIIRLATGEGIQTRVFTNGSMLSERRILELIDAGLTWLVVSLVGATSDSYVAIHPEASKETFGHVLDSLALLQRLKRKTGSRTPNLELRFIATKDSHPEVAEMVNLGIKFGADRVYLSPFRYRQDGNVGTLAPSWDEERLTVERLQEMAPMVAMSGLQINPEELAVYHRYGPVSQTFPCYASWVEMNIEVDGNVTFCVRSRTSVGNIKERSLRDIWLGSRYNALRRLARKPDIRPRIMECDCDRCCLFYVNWQVTRRLATFGLVPKINGVENGISRQENGSTTVVGDGLAASGSHAQ